MFLVMKGKRMLAWMGCCAVGVAALALTANVLDERAAAAAAAANNNWGLSFREPGQQPAGNAGADYLRQYDAYYVGKPDKKVLYITFDAGYENGNTPAILDALKKHNVKAAFFVVGNYIQTSPDLVRRMVEEGHTVGNHTFHHPDMSKISEKPAFQEELQSLEKLFKETTGRELSRFYRPPQGKFSESNLKQAKELGYTTVFWSLAYVDWYADKQPTRDEAFAKLLPRVHPGAVVLLHSTSKTNAEILDELLTRWEAEGYVFGTLEQLAADA